MAEERKKFKARWFRSVTGRYLSIEESDKHLLYVNAETLEDAIEQAKEYEYDDSEIPFLDRVAVVEI